MIRIGTNRCGYIGYTCRGIPQLHGSHETVVEGTTITVQHMFNEANELVSAMRQEFDKLPLRIKGMVFAADTINMGWPEGGPHPEVPEISCRYDTDPFSISKKVAEQSNHIAVAISGQTYQYPVFGSTNGWVDLFNACDVAGGTDGYCYRRDVFLEKTLDTEEGGVTVKGHTLALVDNIPAFVSGNTEYIMGPGLLEPMLDTDFDPIDIDTIPAWEAGDDSFIFTTTVLGAWKGVVDDRFRNVYARLNNIPTAATDYNLRDLKREEYENTDCQNFRINLSSGDSLQTRGNQIANLYTVTDGQVAVDDYTVYVSGDVFTVEPAVEYPIYVWVRVYETDSTGETTTAEIVLLDDSYSIGDELSGGEVIAKEQISVPGSVYRYKYTVQFDDGRKYTGLLFFGFPLPDADDHVVVVGGVRKVFGGTDDDSFVLFKIFQTECSPVMNFASDAETGLHGVIDFDIDGNEIITPLPGSTVTPAPGIVQPAVNIALVVNGSTETNTQSTTDVPTVEAVYNFIHGITAYNGPVANAKATEVELSGISGSTVFGEPVDYVIPINKDRWAQNTEDEITGYTAAESMYEAAKAAWELAGEPTEGEIYEAYIEASTVYSDAYYTVYGYVSDGEPGTTYVINNIVLMNGDMMGVAATTAPSVRAVYNFVHDIYALSTAGTILVNEQNVPYVSHGTPGTVFTIDSLDKARYAAEEYYQDEVPTVRAVIQYVEGRACPSAVKGIISVSAGTESLVSVQGTTAAAGIVQPVKNIDIGTQDPNNVSPDAVPTVQAVYDFIHGYTVTNYKVADAKATADETIAVAGSTVQVKCGTSAVPGTFYVTNDMTSITDTVTTYVAPEAVPTAMSVVNYIRAYVAGHTATASRISVSDDSPYESLDAIHTTGTVDVSRCINLNRTVNKRPESSRVVPTVEAVYNFVHDLTDFYSGSTMSAQSSQATIGTITGTTTGTSSVITGVTASGCVTGTYKVVDKIVGATNAQGGLFSVDDVVPTADAIVKYIKSLNLDPAGMAVSGNLNQNGDWVTAATVSAGIYYVATNVVAGTAGSAAYSSVPTVRAVNDFVAGYTASVGGFSVTAADKEDWETVGTGTSATKRKADPGIVGVVDTLVAATTVSNRSLSTNTVPTVAAVKDYVDEFLVSASTAGVMQENEHNQESCDGAVEGTVTVARNVWLNLTANSRLVSYKAVPTVEAVYNFIRGYTNNYAGYGTFPVASALATPGTIVDDIDTEDNWNEGWNPVPETGTALVASNIKVGQDSQAISTKAVPTVKSVFDFVHSSKSTPDGEKALNTKGTISVNPNGVESITGGTPGTAWVVTNVKVGSEATNKVSPLVVPTVQAVYKFIHNYNTASIASPMAVPVDMQTIGNAATVGIVASTCTPGTFFVTGNMAVVSGATSFPAPAVVPTAEAVAKYIKDNAASKYDGPFAAVSGSSIRGGNVYFDGALFATASDYTTALAASTTYWCVAKKNGSTKTAEIKTGPGTSVYEASVPIVRTDTNSKPTQIHYGDINIEGRWT